ncbi:hypothetical protein ACKF11_13315 [Methylobacillus sp. Pita2]|uniref:hypothetical protein n=1 Tax=Methylobacillus sp. Pita2 TaxID=3383245 RepID=UPI0038B52FD6
MRFPTPTPISRPVDLLHHLLASTGAVSVECAFIFSAHMEYEYFRDKTMKVTLIYPNGDRRACDIDTYLWPQASDYVITRNAEIECEFEEMTYSRVNSYHHTAVPGSQILADLICKLFSTHAELGTQPVLMGELNYNLDGKLSYRFNPRYYSQIQPLHNHETGYWPTALPATKKIIEALKNLPEVKYLICNTLIPMSANISLLDSLNVNNLNGRESRADLGLFKFFDDIKPEDFDIGEQDALYQVNISLVRYANGEIKEFIIKANMSDQIDFEGVVYYPPSSNNVGGQPIRVVSDVVAALNDKGQPDQLLGMIHAGKWHKFSLQEGLTLASQEEIERWWNSPFVQIPIDCALTEDLDAIDYYLEAGLLDAQDDIGNTLLHSLLIKGDVEGTIVLLTDDSPDLSLRNDQGETVWHALVRCLKDVAVGKNKLDFIVQKLTSLEVTQGLQGHLEVIEKLDPIDSALVLESIRSEMANKVAGGHEECKPTTRTMRI